MNRHYVQIFVIMTIVSFNALSNEQKFLIGVDVLQTNYAAKTGTVGEVFYQDPIAFNFYGKYIFMDRFFVEAGYETYPGKNKSKTMKEGEVFANVVMPSPNMLTINTNSKTKTEHPYLGIGFMGNIPKLSNATWNAMIGISNSKVKQDLNYSITRTAIGVTENRPPHNFAKRKLIPILKLGVEYKLQNCFGLRLTGSWLNMNRIKLTSKRNTAVETKMKNGYSLGIGAFYSFI